MNIAEFEVESFRQGNPLRLLDLGGGLNVAAAHSKEGAAELLQIVPATLYGPRRFFSRDTGRLLANVGRTALVIRGRAGVFRIDRTWGDPFDAIQISAADGGPIKSGELDALLDRISWREYRDVFTLDLDRLRRRLARPRNLARQLTRWARRLPVSPPALRSTETVARPNVDWEPLRARIQKMMELASQAIALAAPDSREKAVTPSAGNAVSVAVMPSQEAIPEADLDRLRGQLAETRRGLEENDIEMSVASASLALGRIATWGARLEVEPAAANREPSKATSGGSGQLALERLTERIEATKEELGQLRGELTETAGQIKELAKRGGIARWIPHVEAMLAHEKSLIREEDALEQLRDRVEELQSRVDAARVDVVPREARLPQAELQTIARLEAMHDKLREAEGEQARLEQRLAHPMPLPPPLQSALAADGGGEDALALHAVERRVAELRERIGMSGKSDRLTDQAARLEERVRELYERRLMPPIMVLFFGVPFVAGIAIMIHALFMSRGATNWQQVLWGAILASIFAIIKVLIDHQTMRDLEVARDELRRVKEQLETRAGLDAPGALAALKAELRTAEREAADLKRRTVQAAESLAPPLPRPAESLSTDVLRNQLAEAKRRTRDLGQQFRDTLRDLELSPTLSLAQARETLLGRLTQATTNTPIPEAALPLQHQALKSEWERRREFLGTQIAQARQLAQELGAHRPGESLAECFDVLRDALRDHREHQQARAQLIRTHKRLRERALRLRDQGRELVRQRRKAQMELQTRLGVVAATREIHAAQVKERRQLREHFRRSLQETTEVLGVKSANALGQLSQGVDWEARLAGLRNRREELLALLANQAEEIGKIVGLRSSTGSGKALDEFRKSWREVAETARELNGFVDSARRAPVNSTTANSPAGCEATPPWEVELPAASRYFAVLSGRRYRSVGLDRERRLVVGDRTGAMRTLGGLERTHFANLYFALWLARLDAYAEQGRRLPIVMQDPLEVTPRGRRQAVAELLRGFADRGHQILLVTRRADHARKFAAMGVPVANLESRERVPLISPSVS